MVISIVKYIKTEKKNAPEARDASRLEPRCLRMPTSRRRRRAVARDVANSRRRCVMPRPRMSRL
jgi:hypothetical protein